MKERIWINREGGQFGVFFTLRGQEVVLRRVLLRSVRMHFSEQKSMRCMGLCVNRVAMSVNQFKLWTVSNDVGPRTTRSTRQAVIQFAPCVLPARCHKWFTLTLDTSCIVVEEFENTVLLVLGLARKVCDRSARGTIFAPELFRRNVTGDMRSPWTLSVVLMSKSSENRVLASRLCSHFSSRH